MERASTSCTDWILEHFNIHNEATIICGSGNNGGDGLVVARLLAAHGWKVVVVYPLFGKPSEDFQTNLEKLEKIQQISLHAMHENDPLPPVSSEALVIDALFGSGLTRTLDVPYSNWVEIINGLSNIVIAIDIPSGLFADKTTQGAVVRADFTLSIEVPKLAFLIPENQKYLGEWIILPIGLDQERLQQLESNWFVLTEADVAPTFLPRNKFDHKGVFGHALIVAGSYGKAGAAILASKAALRAGAGLVTAHVPGKLNAILQTAVPEVMVDTDDHLFHFTNLTVDAQFSAIGIGCGLGVDEDTIEGLRVLLDHLKMPIVLDADALNIIALHPDMLTKIPKNSILTPHFKEFARLFGTSDDHFDRLEKLRAVSMRHRVILLLKGAHSAIATPDGNLYFNTTGNPGMATAGSGDVLTGIITGLLAQGYSPFDAAMLGVYVHGLAGDLAAEETGYEALIASDITVHLGDAFQYLHEAGMDAL